MYVYVKDNEVKRKAPVPSSWKDISGFDKASVEVQVSYGWYPLEVSDNPELQLDQYLGAEEYNIQALKVVSSRPVVTRDLAEVKVWLKQKGLEVAKEKLGGEYDLQTQIVGLNGSLGAGFKSTIEGRVDHFIGAYQTFATEVDACNSKVELLVVYNNYPQLH